MPRRSRLVRRPAQPPTARVSRRWGRLPAAILTAAAVALGPVQAASAATPVTPGNFTGYGFDQCLAPTQSAMDTWLKSSPFWAVGIYISGDSRACRSQPNLTPTWIETQLENGWRLLPITLGPQASCSTRFPRYGNDETISPRSTNRYAAARIQGRQEASKAVAVAQGLGIVPGSTLWYDIEAYDHRITSCRESALYFTSAWTKRLHALGYVSGVYSSASSGIRALDDARVERPGTFALPDQIWIARWDGKANTSTSYLRSDGWLPGGRMKQYLGGHNETWGGVTINIDRNWLDLGTGSTPRAERDHCGGVRLNFGRYLTLRADDTGIRVSALQCLLTQQGFYGGELNGVVDSATRGAVRSLRADRGLLPGTVAGPKVWTTLLSQGPTTVLKYGAASERVRRLQRALNAAAGERLTITGVFEETVTAAVKRYQAEHGMVRSGVVTPKLWRLLQSGTV